VTRQKSSSPNQRRFYLLLVGVVSLAAVTVAFLAWLSETGVGGGTVLEGGTEAQELLAGIPQSGTTLGEEDAPVTILLYEDFQFPACAQFLRETFPDLVERHVEPGEVRVVSQTLAFLGPDSISTGRAALAAGQQDRYWNYAALLFLNQGPENSGYATDEFLMDLANETRGLNVDRWNKARTSGSVESELEAVESRARANGVSSTPTLVVSGPGGERKLVGAVPIDEVETAIEEVGAS
jgi:protein-disulfide isomerase